MKDKLVTILTMLAAAVLGFALSSCEALKGIKASYDGDTGEGVIMLPPVRLNGQPMTTEGLQK